MSAKKLVSDFYNSEALTNSEVMAAFLHPEVVVEWNSTKGFLKLNHEEILAMSRELSRAYTQSVVRVSHLVQEKNQVAVRYSLYVKTIENPREEMLVAHFMAIWEVRDDKLYRGFQMSQL